MAAILPLTRIVPRRDPVMQGILIDASEQGVTLTAMNPAIRASVQLPFNALADECGSIIVPDRFPELLQTLPDCDLTISTDKDRDGKETLLARWPNGKCAIPTISETEIETFNSRLTHEREDLQETAVPILESTPDIYLDTVLTAGNSLSEEGTMNVTEYILTENAADAVHIVGTDSRKLYHTVIERKENTSEGTILMPQAAIVAIRGLIDRNGGPVVIKKGKNKAMICQDDKEICFGIIDRKFPDWRPVIPSAGVAEVTVDRKTFLEAVGRLCVAAPENLRIEFTIGPDNIEATSRNTMYGMSARESIPCEGTTDKELHIAVSGKHLTDALKTFRQERVRIRFGGQDRPLLINANDEKDKPEYIIMPLVTKM